MTEQTSTEVARQSRRQASMSGRILLGRADDDNQNASLPPLGKGMGILR